MSMTVIGVNKPAQATATATAIVETDVEYAVHDIVSAGLVALRETRSSLFGYGVRDQNALGRLPAGTYTVYAHRD